MPVPRFVVGYEISEVIYDDYLCNFTLQFTDFCP